VSSSVCENNRPFESARTVSRPDMRMRNAARAHPHPVVPHENYFREPGVWHDLSCVLSNSIEDVLFTIMVEGGMLSSLPELTQPVPQGGLDRESCTIEFFRQRIDTDWYAWTRFCNVPHVCSLMASRFESSKIRVRLSEVYRRFLRSKTVRGVAR
jgi:hypothetical protein